MTIGYDNLSINDSLLMHLTFEEMTGLVTYDRAGPQHPCTLNGVPTWNSLVTGLPYLDFVQATPDWLDCGAVATADLDFTTEDFSIVLWIYPDALGTTQMLVCRGLFNNDGWYLDLAPAGNLALATCQAVTQSSVSDPVITASAWNLVGISRDGASVIPYHNGLDVSFISGTHINPATSARELHIGITDGEINDPFDGKIAGGPCGPRIWGRSLSYRDHRYIWETERQWLGV